MGVLHSEGYFIDKYEGIHSGAPYTRGLKFDIHARFLHSAPSTNSWLVVKVKAIGEGPGSFLHAKLL